MLASSWERSLPSKQMKSVRIRPLAPRINMKISGRRLNLTKILDGSSYSKVKKEMKKGNQGYVRLVLKRETQDAVRLAENERSTNA